MENNIKCLLCSDESSEENEIKKCTDCGLSVHVLCYGIKNEEKFSCSPCREKVKIDEIECAICQKKGGAFKTTTNEKWAHVIWALFYKGTAFEDNELMEPINITNCKFNKTRKCVFCDTAIGVVKCKTRNCQSVLHASCGLTNDTLKEKHKDDGSIEFVGFCKLHGKSEGKDGKRLSADNVKKFLYSKQQKMQKNHAAKSNAEWIVNQLQNDDDTNEASFTITNNDVEQTEAIDIQPEKSVDENAVLSIGASKDVQNQMSLSYTDYEEKTSDEIPTDKQHDENQHNTNQICLSSDENRASGSKHVENPLIIDQLEQNYPNINENQENHTEKSGKSKTDEEKSEENMGDDKVDSKDDDAAETNTQSPGVTEADKQTIVANESDSNTDESDDTNETDMQAIVATEYVQYTNNTGQIHECYKDHVIKSVCITCYCHAKSSTKFIHMF